MRGIFRRKREISAGPVRVMLRRVLVVAAGVLFAVYVGWTAYWLACGEIPPAMLSAFTGLPSPTTGGTRSVMCLLDGDWRGSLAWNPLAMPIAILYVASLAVLARRRRLCLPRTFTIAWLIVLSAAWVAKFVIGSGYW